MTTTSSQEHSSQECSSQERLNRNAQQCAVRSVSRPLNLAAPTVSYQAHGPVLVMGPEHRVRHALALIAGRVEVCALITEAMPQTLDADMETAAALVSDARLVRLPLASVEGYLGRFVVTVKLPDTSANLAQLETNRLHFAAVLDLGSTPVNQAQLKPAGYLTADTVAQLADAVEQLVGLQGDFEKPRYFAINNAQCAHSGAELTGCTRCLESCPADAIRSHQGQIEIDAHLCHGAGGCAAACPTSAIRYNYPQSQLTLDACRRLLKSYFDADGRAPRLLIHDADFGAAWVKSNLPSLDASWLPLELEELGAAGIDLWLSALAWGAEEVVLLQPPSLAENLASTLQQELAHANAILTGLALPSRVRLEAADQPLTTQPAGGEREFGESLGVTGDKRLQLSAATAHLFSHSSIGSGAHTRIPLSSGAPYGQVALQDSRCTLCMACVSICPTPALSAGTDTPQLAFTEDHCVQCGLCEQACPENALQLLPGYQLDPLPREERRVLKQEEPFCCVRCGNPFATQGAVALMLEKLAGHSMFAGAAAERLKMCGDCRVVDLVQSDPSSDLFEHAKGRSVTKGDLNMVQIQEGQS